MRQEVFVGARVTAATARPRRATAAGRPRPSEHGIGGRPAGASGTPSAATPRGSTRPSGLRAVAGGAPGHARPGSRCRAPSATRCTRPTAGRPLGAARPRRPRRARRAAPAVRRHDRRAGRAAVVRRGLAVRRARRGPAVRRGLAATPAAAARPGGASTVDAGDELGELPRPWRPMIGSEHLSHLLSTDTTGGRVIGEELTAALRRGARRARRHARAGARDPRRRPRRLPRGRRRAGARLLRRRPGLRPPALDRALPGRRALVHAARPGPRPGQDGVRVRRDRLAAQGLGPLARPDRATWPRTSPTATARRGASSTGRSRCGTRPTSRCSGRARRRSTCGSTTSPPPRSATVDARLRVGGPVLGGGRLGRGAARPRRASGRAGRLRHHAHLRQPAAGLPADAGALRPRPGPRSGGPSGASRRRTSTRSATPSSPARSCCAGCARRWAGSRRCPTGWSPTTSRSSAGRRRCCTAASGCAPSASCASRAGGRWPCSSGSAPPARRVAGRRRRRLAGRGARGHAGSGDGRCCCGTSRSTRPRPPAPRPGPRGRRRGPRPRAGGVVHAPPRPRRRRPLQHRGGLGPDQEDGQDWPTEEQWAQLRAADRLEALEPDRS